MTGKQGYFTFGLGKRVCSFLHGLVIVLNFICVLVYPTYHSCNHNTCCYLKNKSIEHQGRELHSFKNHVLINKLISLSCLCFPASALVQLLL